MHLLLNVIFQLNSKTTHFQTHVHMNFFFCFDGNKSLFNFVQHFRYTLYSTGGIWLNMNSMAHWQNDKWQGEKEVACIKNNLSWCQHKTHIDCSKKER